MTLALITGEPITSVIAWIIVFGLIFWLLWWLLDYIALPQPFAKVGKVVLALLAVVLLIRLIIKIFGVPW